MKETNKIYQALLNRKEKVCHRSEILKIIKEYKKKFKSKINTINIIKYLSRHNYIKRIFKNYFYLNSVDERQRKYCLYEDKELFFIVLDKLSIKWYIGLNSALYLAGKTWQVSRTLYIINNKFVGAKNILDLKIKFSKVKDSLFIGLKKGQTTNKIDYFYSIPSKTYLDMVYLKKSNKLVRDNQTKKYLKHYPKWVGKR